MAVFYAVSFLMGLGIVLYGAIRLADLVVGIKESEKDDGFVSWAAPRLVVFGIVIMFGILVIAGSVYGLVK